LAFQAFTGRDGLSPAEYERAFTGALLWGEHIDNTRAVRMHIDSYAKSSGKKSRRRR